MILDQLWLDGMLIMNKIMFSMIALSLMLSACAKTKEDALISFKQNKSTYVVIVEQLRLFPKIKTINPNLKKTGLSETTGFDKQTLDIYDQLMTKAKNIDLASIQAIRDKSGSELEGVSFAIPYGLDASKLIDIIYVSQGQKVEDFYPDETVCEIIDSPSWYLCVTDNR